MSYGVFIGLSAVALEVSKGSITSVTRMPSVRSLRADWIRSEEVFSADALPQPVSLSFHTTVLMFGIRSTS